MAIGTGSLSHGDAIVLFLSLGRPGARPSGPRPMPIDAVSPTDSGEGRRRTGQERLEASDARIHVAADRDPATVGYATFTNETTSAATLVALDCPAFDRVELRETIAVDGVARTRRTSSLSVLSGDSVELAPGGRLLSMSGPRRPLAEGELVGVTMTFASGRRRVVPFRVVADASPRYRGGR